MKVRQRLLAYLQQHGLSTARAEVNLDAFRDEILREAAGQIRSYRGALDGAEWPEFAADLIDPDAH